LSGKKFWIVMGALGLCILVCIGVALSGALRVRSNRAAKVYVSVTDGFDGTPVAGVQVSIAQTGQKLQSDQQGNTENFTIARAESAYADLPLGLRADWQEVTVVLHHPDYVDTVVLNVAVTPGQQRQLSVEMFSKEDLPSQQIVTICESPPQQWLETLVKRFS
jgi:hypothetical protein